MHQKLESEEKILKILCQNKEQVNIPNINQDLPALSAIKIISCVTSRNGLLIFISKVEECGRIRAKDISINKQQFS